MSEPAHAGVLAAWTLVVRAAGTLVTVIGFAVAIVQLMKTKSAAQAAEAAALEVKSRVATFDMVYELSRAAASIRETQRHLHASSWGSALDSYLGAKDALVRLVELSTKLTAEERGNIGAMIIDIGNVCDRIESGLLKNKILVDRSRVMKNSRTHEQLLSRLNVTIQKGLS